MWCMWTRAVLLGVSTIPKVRHLMLHPQCPTENGRLASPHISSTCLGSSGMVAMQVRQARDVSHLPCESQIRSASQYSQPGPLGKDSEGDDVSTDPL